MRVKLLVLAAALLAGCGGGKAGRPPVVVLALDGVEWSVLRPLMEEGRAPNLRALAERGIAGKLETDLPTYSPLLWTSIATGVRPDTHGVKFFAEVNAAGAVKPDGLPYTSNSRRVPAIWNICGDHGRTVLSVGWWVSWPAEVVPGGRIVASYAAQAQGKILWKAGVWTDGLEDLTYPPGLQAEIAPFLRDGAPSGPLRAEFDAAFRTAPQIPEWEFERTLEQLLRFAFHGDRTHERIFVHELERGVADLNLFYVGLPDVAGHFYWRYREPTAYGYRIPLAKLDLLGERIDEVYAEVDTWIGEVLANVPEDALVLVLSDHGMHAAFPDEPGAFPSGGHQDGPPGILIAAGPGIAPKGLPPGEPPIVASIYDVFPTLLMMLDLALPADAVGSPRTAWMTPEWLAAHPLTHVPTYAAGYREATPPRAPAGDANTTFLEGMKALGYF
jgi:hypothetical protein